MLAEHHGERASSIDDFEVSIFLTEPSTRHSILMRHKTFLEKGTKLKGNSSKMTGTKEEPFEVVGEDDDDVVLVREEDDREMKLDAITVADYDEAGHPTSKAPNPDGLRISPADTDLEAAFEDQTDQLDAAAITARPKQSQQAHGVGSDLQGDLGADDKKKRAFNTTYEGFSIYRRILCLVVKRRGISKGKQLVGGTGQAMMEEWITSSQMGQRQTTEE